MYKNVQNLSGRAMQICRGSSLLAGMIRLAPLLLAALPAPADPVSVPSGQRVDLVETFWDLTDESAPTLRLRFLAPEIGAVRGFAEVEADFAPSAYPRSLPNATAR